MVYLCRMVVFQVRIDNIAEDVVYTSLLAVCMNYNLSYSAATKGREEWVRDGKTYKIARVEVIKIKGREDNRNRKKGKASEFY